MAYAGYLIKVGGANGVILPMDCIAFDSYKSTPDQRMESQATRSVTGLLHRTTVEHTATKIEFSTPPITNRQLATLNAIFRSHYTNALERKLTINYYDQETDSYRDAECYMPDVDYEINHINNDTNTVYYNSIRFAFIEY